MGELLDIMKNSGALFASEQAKNEIRVCNEYSEKFGLTLGEKEIEALVKSREEALQKSGRVEFGGGILPKLICAFCDSPYLEQENYEETLERLQEIFYYYKTEANDYYTDDELIGFMEKVFNGRAGGDTDYLEGTALDALCRYAGTDYDPEDERGAGDLF